MISLSQLRAPARWLAITAAVAAVVSCSSTAPKKRIVGLWFGSGTKLPGSALRAANFSVTVGTGANSITITKVEFVLARTELASAATCSIPPSNNDNCDEMELDPILIDLPLGTAPSKALDASLPQGTYTRLQAELDAVQVSDGEGGAAAFLAAHPTWPSGLSVRVTGVYIDANGASQNFTYTSTVQANIEMQFSTPITIDANTTAITIAVDVTKWFKNASGAVIDPRVAGNAATIDANIRASFQVFEDDDHDGGEDPT